MSITKPNQTNNRQSQTRWTATNQWVLALDCDVVNFTPGNKAVDSCNDNKSICNALANASLLKVNTQGNFSVYFTYSNGTIGLLGFVDACEGYDETSMLIQLHELDADSVTKALTADEMEAEWNDIQAS